MAGKHRDFNTQHDTRNNGKGGQKSRPEHSTVQEWSVFWKVHLCIFPEYSVVRPSGVVLWEARKIKGEVVMLC